MVLWPPKNKKNPRTRIKIVAEARSTKLHWDAPAEGSSRGDPFAPLRPVCAKPTKAQLSEEREGEADTGRPHFCAVADFRLVRIPLVGAHTQGLEFDALLAALNSCVLDSLTVTLETGGVFPCADSFAERLIDRLELPLRRLRVESLSPALPLHELKRAVPAMARYVASPATAEVHEIGVAGYAAPRATDTMTQFIGLLESGQWAGYCCPGQGYRGPREKVRPNAKFKPLRESVNAYYVVNRRPHAQLRRDALRALVTARELLSAPRTERTGFADLPTELIHEIVRTAVWPGSTSPDVGAAGGASAHEGLTPRQWGVVLRHAEDREALARVAAEFTRLGVRSQRRPKAIRRADPLAQELRAEWMYNGGFGAPIDRPAMGAFGRGEKYVPAPDSPPQNACTQ
ncbi:hypothetical protein Q8F55_005423 [Vanrija albida]|uniref:Uncharacterized protein n=1 Tax=Vanrija albida TaxID=181172 RepID=A0ABR3Q1M4_9TREE